MKIITNILLLSPLKLTPDCYYSVNNKATLSVALICLSEIQASV
ncbi:hypothetical protein HMPREF0208_00104 [Citrobacter koseri]|uniref:Uncharacterized protein n=1 Tax=Citrobacter koseri (strain ATCC BAA-895 / CDC 4225-83 / SGSC4696) TaxID=290338 RepID=A8AJ66_CITK8|nr:hypothetical protein CKO_02412 [Citrobacter koseri ATCC BAA-895]KXA02401.1 hypothetical protein HMPREF3220_00926 [Citrobacter koseri]KXA05741.1 hypothetical protein HMPREF3207_00655 [Citrobacter koseri]KXB47460.1 hypothetical protein HMPREF0208_00104 [Citrobacter koseri]